LSDGSSAKESRGFEEEALPHLDAVYRFALRLSGAPDQADDLVQETFLRAIHEGDRREELAFHDLPQPLLEEKGAGSAAGRDRRRER
jgi:DNA-directed RNA polymerase specialized sigma24 family protein